MTVSTDSIPALRSHRTAYRRLRGRWHRIRVWARRVVLAAAIVFTSGVLLLAIAWALWPFPTQRLQWPENRVVTDRNGRVMAALTAVDGQWRTPVPLERMSPWLVQATVAAEDQRFWSHAGVDPRAVVRAATSNLAAGRVVSGASTLTMQVCRMLDDRPRTWRAKLVEGFRALQLERCVGKGGILELYLNAAPYGRNYRGAEAAANAWFSKSAADLSLAEAALLAGLPKSPTRYDPARSPHAARARRDAVLRRMAAEGMISDARCAEAIGEPVWLRPQRRSIVAPHAAMLAFQRRHDGGRTTIDLQWQAEVERLVAEHATMRPAGCDAAVVVLDLAGGDIVALVGSADVDDPIDGQVDGSRARRSPGSALKPFIYAAAFEAGRLAPESVVYDVPIVRGGWSPDNADDSFAGPMSAADALRRSRNVPAILVTEAVGIARCVGVLEAAGVSLPVSAVSRSGLACAVGGVDVTLLDVTNAYATLGRGGVWVRPRLFMDENVDTRRVLDRDVCAAIDDILGSHRRRPNGFEDRAPDAVPWFMWKTGTSARQRDAWAVGHNHHVAIGVWVGRFDGRPCSGLSGAETAEPLLARLFNLPGIRATAVPPAPPSRAPVRPLPPPDEARDVFRITYPSDRATFVALDGVAVFSPRATRQDGVQWFIDGAWHSDGLPGRIALAPGAHELRCVASSGEAAAIRVAVR